MSSNKIGSDDFKWNFALTWASAIKEFSDINKEEPAWRNTLHVVFGLLKLLPFVGNAVYLSQMTISWLQDKIQPIDQTIQQVSSEHLKPKPLIEEKPEISSEKAALEAVSTDGMALAKLPPEFKYNARVIKKALEQLDTQFDKLDEAGKKELSHKLETIYGSDFQFGYGALPVWDFLLKKVGPQPLCELIEDKTNFYSESNHWIEWAVKNAPLLADKCIEKQTDPLKLILAEDPTRGQLWEHLKNRQVIDKDYIKTLTEKAPITLFRFEQAREANAIIEKLFDSTDDIFVPLMSYLRKGKEGELLSFLIDHMYNPETRKVVEDIAKKHPDRLKSLIENESSVYVAALETSSIIIPETLKHLMIFTDLCGDDVLKLVKSNGKITEKFFSDLKGDVDREKQNLLWNRLYKYDPHLFRKRALELASLPESQGRLNLAEQALALNDAVLGYPALLWLMKSDVPLFMQLVAMSPNFIDTKKSSLPYDQIFSTYNVLTLDPENLPTAQEFVQFYTAFMPMPNLKPEIHIPLTSIEKQDKIFELFKAIDKQNCDDVKIVLEDPAFALKRTSYNPDNTEITPAVIAANQPLLACFGLKGDDVEHMSKKKVVELLSFIHKGECSLENASQMYTYFKNFKALDYAGPGKTVENDPKRNFDLTWKIGDKEFSFKVHKAILSNINEHLDDMVGADDEEALSQVFPIGNQEDFEFNPSSPALFLDWLYGKKPFNLDQISDPDELSSLFCLADHTGLQDWADLITHKLYSLCIKDPALVAGMDLKERQFLLNRMSDLQDEELFFKIKFLTGMPPEERKTLVKWLLTDFKMKDPETGEKVPFSEDLFFMAMRRAKLKDNELQDIVDLVKELDRPELYADMISLMKKPFTALIEAGNHLETFKWLLKSQHDQRLKGQHIEPSIVNLLHKESQKINAISIPGPYVSVLSTFKESPHRDEFYALLESKSPEITPGMVLEFGANGLLDLLLEDIANEKAKNCLRFFINDQPRGYTYLCVRCNSSNALSKPENLKELSRLDNNQLVSYLIKDSNVKIEKDRQKLVLLKKHFPELFDEVATPKQKEAIE